jgi:hypothetical protein
VKELGTASKFLSKVGKGGGILAKTTASGVRMTNEGLATLGILSLKTLWTELAHLRGTAAALLCIEPTRPDPHAWWCEEGARNRVSLPDFISDVSHGDVSVWRIISQGTLIATVTSQTTIIELGSTHWGKLPRRIVVPSLVSNELRCIESPITGSGSNPYRSNISFAWERISPRAGSRTSRTSLAALTLLKAAYAKSNPTSGTTRRSNLPVSAPGAPGG